MAKKILANPYIPKKGPKNYIGIYVPNNVGNYLFGKRAFSKKFISDILRENFEKIKGFATNNGEHRIIVFDNFIGFALVLSIKKYEKDYFCIKLYTEIWDEDKYGFENPYDLPVVEL